MRCRHCDSILEYTFIDLGFSPPSNSYLNADDLLKPEKYFPLKVRVCTNCWLVQTEDYAEASDLFDSNYAYFSSTSKTWLSHAKSYSLNIIDRENLNSQSFVIEIASNDGYLLKNFIDKLIPCLGIEPTLSTARVAEKKNIPVLKEFFTEKIARELLLQGKSADLIIANNVYAHVPDINDFTKGLKAILKPEGLINIEFPHLLNIINFNQFDTIYHEHFSYLSIFTVNKIFKKFGLRIFDVEKIPTHGGSLRIYGCHDESSRKNSEVVEDLLREERIYGLQDINKYKYFNVHANHIKYNLINFLIENKKNNKKVFGYGAAAKGSTLLNYAGIKEDLLPCIFDAAESKQGKYMPGSHIEIFHPKFLASDPPDFLIIFPWNLAAEIKEQNKNLLKFGTKFVIAIPELRLI